MKTVFFPILFLLLLPAVCWTQQNNQPLDWQAAMANPNANYYDIVAAAEAHFLAFPDDPFKKTFYRWNSFWRDRHSNEQNPGSFKPAYEELLKIITGTSLNSVCSDSPTAFTPWKSLGPDQLPFNETSANGLGIVSKVLVDTHDPTGNTIYCGTNSSGVWKTTNGQAAANQVRWASVSDDCRIPAMGVQDMVITGKGYIFVATGYESRFNNTYGVGLLANLGNGWITTSLTVSPSDLKQSFSLATFPFNDPNIDDYVLASLPNEIYLSRDEGIEFEKVYEFTPSGSGPNDGRRILDLTFHPTNEHIFYAVLGDNFAKYEDTGGSEILRFEYSSTTDKYELTYSHTSIDLITDNGGTLPDSTIGSIGWIPRIDLETHASNSNWLYAVIPILEIDSAGNESTHSLKIMKSEDQGVTWDMLLDQVATGFLVGREMNDIEIGSLPQNQGFLVKGGVNPYFTNSLLTNPVPDLAIINNTYDAQSNLHPDIRDVELKIIPNPLNSSQLIEVLLFGHDGGVGRSYDLGANWEDISTGLNISQFYGFSVAADDSYLVGGCQDLSFLWYRNGEWRNPELLGDGGETAIDQFNPNYVYGHNQGSLMESDTTIFPGDFNTVFPPPAGAPPSSPNTGRPHRMKNQERGYIYIGMQDLHRRHTSGTWQQIGTIGTGSALNSFGISSSDINIAYVSGGWSAYGGPDNLPDKFHKTTNANDPANASWTSISEDCCPLNYSEIIDIAVSPNDSKKVWIALNHFHEGIKVFFSSTGGIPQGSITCTANGEDNQGLWKNVSQGLPNFPVNRLIYWEGTHDAMFAATDVGVYFNPHASDPNSSWQCLNAGLPTCIIMDLEMNSCGGKLYAATHGRGIWSLDLPKPEKVAGVNVEAVKLPASAYWLPGTTRILNSDLIIPSGMTLIIQGEVRTANRKTIIVEPNAKLIVDGGLLTNLCNEPWGGITVVGNKNEHQHNLKQGYVTTRNNAIIENATTAVRLWKEGDYNTSGGVLLASNTTFRNNARDVEFIRYTNFNPANSSQKVGNLSKFENCTFVTYDSYFNLFSSEPLAHITMWQVDGVSIGGCTFENARTSPIKGTGIYTIDAGFTVSSFNNKVSQFLKLNRGIDVLNKNDLNSYTVLNAKFVQNSIGIYNSGVNNPHITYCDFQIGAPGISRNFGIYLNGGTGYTIQENTFSGTNAPFVDKIGILARETGNELNHIYRNNFQGLRWANLSNGDNTGGIGSETVINFKGLKYECNTNVNNVYDFRVPMAAQVPSGVSRMQAGAAIGQQNFLSAANGFTDENTFQSLQSHFSNFGDALFYKSFPNQAPTVIEGFVSPDFTQVSPNLCEAQRVIEDGDTRLTTPKREQLTTQFNNNIALLNTAEAAFLNLMDGGNSQGLIEQINNAPANKRVWLKNELLNISPYLSQEALRAATNRTTALFNHNDLFDICKANPDELSNDFMTYLLLMPNPLPTALMDSLYTYVGQVTVRTNDLMEMSAYGINAYSAANHLIHDLLMTDSTITNVPLLRTWLVNKNSLNADYAIISSYIAEKDTTVAKQLTNQIPINYTLSPAQQLDYNNFQTLQILEIELIKEDRNWAQLDSNEINILLAIATDDEGTVGKKAQNVLAFHYGYDYFREPIVGESAQQLSIPFSEGQNQILEKEAKESDWYATPNPATDEVIIHYILADNQPKAVLLITDSKGQTVLKADLNPYSDQFLWKAIDINSGIYFYSLLYNDSVQKTKKVLLIK